MMSEQTTCGGLPEPCVSALIGDVCAVRRQTMRRVLTSATATRVVAEVADFDELLTAVEATRPNVLVVRDDVLRVLGDRAVNAYTHLCAAGGPPRILLLTESSPLELAHAAIFGHLWGCMSDSRVEESLVKAVIGIARGEVWFSRREVTELLHLRAERAAPAGIEQLGLHGVTRRELEVVNLIVRGRTNKEIAKTMEISELTVKTHVQNILKKCGLRRRGELPERIRAHQ